MISANVAVLADCYDLNMDVYVFMGNLVVRKCKLHVTTFDFTT